MKPSRGLISRPADSRPNATSTSSNTCSRPRYAVSRRRQSPASGPTGSTVTIRTRQPWAASRRASANLAMYPPKKCCQIDGGDQQVDPLGRVVGHRPVQRGDLVRHLGGAVGQPDAARLHDQRRRRQGIETQPRLGPISGADRNQPAPRKGVQEHPFRPQGLGPAQQFAGASAGQRQQRPDRPLRGQEVAQRAALGAGHPVATAQQQDRRRTAAAGRRRRSSAGATCGPVRAPGADGSAGRAARASGWPRRGRGTRDRAARSRTAGAARRRSPPPTRPPARSSDRGSGRTARAGRGARTPTDRAAAATRPP